jgi:hypothetical protein
MKKLALAAAALGIFTGLGGSTHGPGEMLQGNIAPKSFEIQAQFCCFSSAEALFHRSSV